MAVLVSGFLSGYNSSSSASETTSLAQQVGNIVQPQLDKYPNVGLGVAVGVVQPGTNNAIATSIFYFGQLVDQNGDPIPLDGATEYEIGSVTKTFTTTVLASQIQERPWLLNVFTNRIFPQTPTFMGQRTMIRDLADYTSGLPDTNRNGGSTRCKVSGGTIEDCYDVDLMFQHLSELKPLCTAVRAWHSISLLRPGSRAPSAGRTCTRRLIQQRSASAFSGVESHGWFDPA